MTINNETLGQSAEKVICDLSGLDSSHLAHRSNLSYERELIPLITKALNELPHITRHLGLERGKNQEKSSIDFMTEANETISIKTNLKGDKQCPSRCGQPGNETFNKFFSHLYPSHFNGNINFEKFEELFRTQFHKMLPIYLENLFDCNYMLWIFKRKKGWNYKIIRRKIIPFNYEWNIKDFSFSHINRDWRNKGKLSSTVKFFGSTGYDYKNGNAPNSIGEFQVHKNRSGYKYRFNIEKYFKMFGLI